MITDQTKIDTSQQQSDNTCLLSSYSIVGNYFTKQAVDEYFKSYYNQYLEYFIKNEVIFEIPSFYQWQAKHILDELIDKQSGYKKILNLHNNSNQVAFIEDRTKFNCQAVNINEYMVVTNIDSKFYKRTIYEILINEKNKRSFHSKELTFLDSYFEQINITTWPRFEAIFELHLSSLQIPMKNFKFLEKSIGIKNEIVCEKFGALIVLLTIIESPSGKYLIN